MAKSGEIVSEQDLITFLESNGDKKPKSHKYERALGFVIGGIAIGVSTMSFPFILPFFRRVCLPFVPATTEQVKNVVEALKGRSGKVVDLGSGDGRVVIAAARNNFEASGIELNPILAFYSRWASFRAGVYKRVNFHVRDLWKFNLKPYRNVVVFGTENMMVQLEKKLSAELERDSQIIACRFPLPNVKPERVIGLGLDRVWVYKMN